MSTSYPQADGRRQELGSLGSASTQRVDDRAHAGLTFLVVLLCVAKRFTGHAALRANVKEREPIGGDVDISNLAMAMHDRSDEAVELQCFWRPGRLEILHAIERSRWGWWRWRSL